MDLQVAMQPRTPASETFSSSILLPDITMCVRPSGGESAFRGDTLSCNSTCCVENALDLREFLEGKDCELIVTDDKEGDDSGASHERQ
jgi:hypothetical protein